MLGYTRESARAGVRYVGPLLAAGALLGGIRRKKSAAAVLAAAAFAAWTFRDPYRPLPPDDGSIYCPADGTVLRIDGDTIQIFMWLWGVHVYRCPTSGLVGRPQWAGKARWPAMVPQASDNHRVEQQIGNVTLTAISGIAARKISLFRQPGQWVTAGERMGIIHLGSQVRLRIPPGYRFTVAPRSRVRASMCIALPVV